jgi:hypothetical protein
VSWWWDRHHRTDLRITFLSVGHGDSAVIEFPGSAVMVLDGGGSGDGSFDPGRGSSHRSGSRNRPADHLVLSHPQADHFGGPGSRHPVRTARPVVQRPTPMPSYRAFSRLERPACGGCTCGGATTVASAPSRSTHCGPRPPDPPRRGRRRSTTSRSCCSSRMPVRVLFTGDIGTRPRADARHLLRDALRSDVLGAAPRRRPSSTALPRRRRAAPGGRVVRTARPVPPAPACGVGSLRAVAACCAPIAMAQ